MPPREKRTRKSTNTILDKTENNEEVTTPKPTEETRGKKRGRKPRGGKIIAAAAADLEITVPEPNVILHLRCGAADLVKDELSWPGVPEPTSSSEFSGDFGGGDTLLYEVIPKSKYPVQKLNHHDDLIDSSTKTLWNKLDELAISLHTNDISDKKSACFWDTCDFDSPPIHIPKCVVGDTYQCYGCFCSPECAVAHLFREPLDTATRFERYALLNHVYCKIYDYNKNIKPAPDPFHTLDKYYGNLTVQEYRQHLKSERILLVVDKPLTRVLPELHEDNDEFVLNTKAIPSSGQFKLRRGRQKQSKAEVLAENFNMR